MGSSLFCHRSFFLRRTLVHVISEVVAEFFVHGPDLLISISM